MNKISFNGGCIKKIRLLLNTVQQLLIAYNLLLSDY